MEKMNSLDRMKKENEKSILRIVHENPGIYRKLITEKAHLSSQTVTNLVAEMVEERILLQQPVAPSSRGRSPVSLSINYAGIYIMTAEVSLDKLEVCLHALSGVKAVCKRERLTGKEDVLERLKNLVGQVSKSSAGKKIQALVVSVAGIVNEDTGTVVVAEKLRWHNLNLAKELEDLGVPVLVRNDANLIACYEKSRHANTMNFMVAKIDIGIGSSFVLGSRGLKSTNNVAGELGHLTVVSEEKRPCVCGKTNCLTKFLSVEGLEQSYGKSYRRLVRDVKRGVPEAIRLVEQVCAHLARILANVIILLDLDTIVLCGCTVANFSEIIAPCLSEGIRSRLSYWVSFQGLEWHAGTDIAVVSSQFWLDYYFSVAEARFL